MYKAMNKRMNEGVNCFKLKKNQKYMLTGVPAGCRKPFQLLYH